METKSLDAIEKAIEDKKNELALTNNQPSLPEHDTEVMLLIKTQEKELLGTKEVQDLGKKFSEERIKADLASEASRIRRKNIETAENEFGNETRELRLKYLKAEMEREHKYNMSTLEQDAKHCQILNKKRKLVEQFGYLYDNTPDKCIDAIDGKGNTYKVPRDFSYSKVVNVIRQFGRNISKLDRPILQTIKWVFIIGAGVAVIYILKRLGII